MKPVTVLCVLGLSLSSAPAFAVDEMYKTKNCFACHRPDKDHLGPSFKRIAGARETAA